MARGASDLAHRRTLRWMLAVAVLALAAGAVAVANAALLRVAGSAPDQVGSLSARLADASLPATAAPATTASATTTAQVATAPAATTQAGLIAPSIARDTDGDGDGAPAATTGSSKGTRHGDGGSDGDRGSHRDD